MRRRTKVLGGVALATLLGVAACVALWPERFVVNAPVRHLIFGRGIEPPPEDALLARLRPPAGARVSRLATDLPNVRFLRLTPSGDLLASQPRAGRVVLVKADRDGDGRSDGRHEVVAGLDRPHGLDLHDGWLYVAETGAVGIASVSTRRAAGPRAPSSASSPLGAQEPVQRLV